jgi:hypothetical protein
MEEGQGAGIEAGSVMDIRHLEGMGETRIEAEAWTSIGPMKTSE